jgi:peptidoglycan/LPS O-acetylase OafA/YrhL
MPYLATVKDDTPLDAHARGHAYYQEALTGVRALAAAWVMLFHVNAFAGPRILAIEPFGVRMALHPLLTVGWVGVTIFFVLSGFLLTTHLLDALERRDERVMPRYFAARLRRVIPAFWAQLAILFVVAFAIAQAPPPWTRYIPLHLLMLHNVSETASYSINSVYWTLPIEFAFYFVLPIIVVRLARLDARGRSPWKTLVLLYAAALAVSVAYRFAVYPLGGTNIAWISNQLPGTIDQFVLGTVLAAQWRWWRKSGEAAARAARLSDALTVGGLAGMVAMIYYLDGIYETFWIGSSAVYWWYSVDAIFAGAIVLGAAMGGRVARALFANPVALFLGTISYSLYLWHYPVVEWLRPLGLGYAAFFAAAIPLCIVASALSYALVERPFLKSRAGTPTASSSAPRRLA